MRTSDTRSRLVGPATVLDLGPKIAPNPVNLVTNPRNRRSDLGHPRHISKGQGRAGHGMAWMSHTPGQTGPEPVAPQPSADVRQRMAWHARRRSLPNLHWRVSERMRPNQHAPSRQAARCTVKAALARPIQTIALASASSLDRLCRSSFQIRASSF